MISYWRSFIWQVASAPSLLITGVRKVAEDQSFHLPYGALLSNVLRYEDICYTKAKGAQLHRNYWNQSAVDAAVEKLRSRSGKPHSSVSIQLQGQGKDSRSQGFCMQNMVITMTAGTCDVDIYYRSTELIQKFLADLIFFSSKLPPIFDDLERNPTTIRFRFANVYLSAVFMPIFLRYETEPLRFFQDMQQADPKFYRTCGLATRRFFNETHNYSYRTRVKMFEYWKEHVTPSRPLQKMLSGLKGDFIEDEGDDE